MLRLEALLAKAEDGRRLSEPGPRSAGGGDLTRPRRGDSLDQVLSDMSPVCTHLIVPRTRRSFDMRVRIFPIAGRR